MGTRGSPVAPHGSALKSGMEAVWRLKRLLDEKSEEGE